MTRYKLTEVANKKLFRIDIESTETRFDNTNVFFSISISPRTVNNLALEPNPKIVYQITEKHTNTHTCTEKI